MENIGNGLMASVLHERKQYGMQTFVASTIYAQFQGASGEVELKDGEWPEDGVEWDVCPAEWESLESDLQDWSESTEIVMERLKLV
tara:strand:- start:567 stop:824 length:258 start_codon:yes stop_codon:yes gene_type:complete